VPAGIFVLAPGRFRRDEPTLRTLRAVYGKLMVADQKRAAEAMAGLAR
jgi:hypothetical protein